MRLRDPKGEMMVRPRRVWPVGVAVVLASLAACFLLRTKPHDAPAVKSDRADVRHSTYHNRATWRPRAGAAEEAAPASPAITGTVYGTDGSPVSGATVTAATFEIAGNVPTTAAAAQSDEVGRFTLNLADGSYNLSAARGGYGTTFLAARTGDDVSLILPRSGVIDGHVYDERRAPVGHFTIDVLTTLPDDMAAPAPLWSKTFDSPDGAFRVDQLPTWAVRLRATAPGYAPAYTPHVRVDPAGQSQIDLVLPVGCPVDGSVEDTSGAPLPAVFVDAEARTAAGTAGATSLEATSQGKSDLQGHFHLEHVPPGKVLVRGYDGVNAVTTATLEIADCATLAPVKLVMSPGGGLRGVVRGVDGEPLAGVKLTANHRSIGYVSALSDAAGVYRFDQLPPSVVRVEARDGDQVTALFVTVKNGDVTERDISLPGRGSGEVRGRVTAGDRPLAATRVVVMSNLGPERGVTTRAVVTDRDGVYHASDLPEGGYMVQVASTQHAKGVRVEPGKVQTADLDVSARLFPAKSTGGD
jgi:Carboxypeptidase regulatory-like domain